MTTISYTKTATDQYTPKNIIATDSIKCRNCEQMIKSNELERHTKKHLITDNRFTNQNNQIINRLKKFDLKALILDEENMKDIKQDIGVKSFLPEELPMAEKIERPQVSDIKAKILKNKQMNGFPIQYLIEQQNQQTTDAEQLNGHMQASILIASRSPQLSIQKELTIKPIQSKLKNKKIKFYQSKNQTEQLQNCEHDDETHLVPKIMKPLIQANKQNTQFYNIQLNRKRQRNTTIENNVQTFAINTKRSSELKFMKNKQKISTFSTSRGFFNTNNSSLMFAKNHSQATHNTQFQSDKKLQCQQCKGFYCKSCGSDIPPIFRPVPNRNRQYFNGIESYKQFLKHQNNQHNSCRDCDEM